jgi:hypothetical protein
MTNLGEGAGFAGFCPIDNNVKDRRKLKMSNFFIRLLFVLATKLGY